MALVLASVGVASAAPRRHHAPARHHARHPAHALSAPHEDTSIQVELKLSPPAPSMAPPAVAETSPTPTARAQLELPVRPPPAPAPPPATLLSPRSKVTATAAGDESHRERRWGLFGGGLALFLAGYALDVGASYGLGHVPAATSLIPLAGPLVQIGDSWAVVAPSATGNPQIDGPANDRIAGVNRAAQSAAYAVLAVDFAMQLTGAVMTVVGAVGRAPRDYAVAPGARVAFSGRGLALEF